MLIDDFLPIYDVSDAVATVVKADSLTVRAIDEQHTLLSGAMRTATTDEQARKWFRRYWTLGVGSGAHIVVGGLLELARDEAERRAADGS